MDEAVEEGTIGEEVVKTFVFQSGEESSEAEHIEEEEFLAEEECEERGSGDGFFLTRLKVFDALESAGESVAERELDRMKIGDLVAFIDEMFPQKFELCGFSAPIHAGKGDVFHRLRVSKSVILGNEEWFFGRGLKVSRMHKKRFVIYPFLVFLFFVPLQTVYLLREPIIGGEKWQYGTIGIFATDILLMLVFGGYCLEYFLRKRLEQSIKGQRRWMARSTGTQKQLFLMPFASEKTAKKKFVFAFQYSLDHFLLKSSTWFFGFILWAGLSILWAPDRVLAGYFFVKLLLAAGVFSLIRSFGKRETGLIITVLFIGAVLESVLSIGQFLSQSTFVSSWLGMSGHEAWQAGTSVLKNESCRWLRAYGTFSHPNMLGGYLGVVLILGLGYLVQSALSIKKRLLFEGGSVVVLLGLILTFSRTAWLGIVFGIVLVGFCAWRENEFRIRRRFLEAGFVLGLTGLVFGFILQEQVFPRFDTATIGREGSVSARVISFQDTWTLIRQHPFIGTGTGNSTAQLMKENPNRPIWGIQPAHNVPLLIWSELGLIGLLLSVGFIVSLSFSKSTLFGPQFAGLIVLFPSLLSDHWLWTSHFGLLLFAFLLGYASRPPQGLESTSQESLSST